MKILIAVDGSECSAKAVRYIATHFSQFQGTPELHVIHVQMPIPRGLALVQAEKLLGGDVDERYYKEESEAALKPAEQILRESNMPFHSTYKVGDIAKEINDYATENGMDMIVMGSHGHGAMSNLLLGSVATKVLAMTHIPALIIR